MRMRACKSLFDVSFFLNGSCDERNKKKRKTLLMNKDDDKINLTNTSKWEMLQ